MPRVRLASIGMAIALSVVTAMAADIGAPAPAFSARAADGQKVTLSDYAGKWVVLEWHNPGCEFTQKHYGSGNLPGLQKQWRARGVVWLTVVAPTVPMEKAVSYLRTNKATPTAILSDADAKLAYAYGAKTTPQMFVIDPKGRLVYNGAIDDKPTASVADLAVAKNYVSAALTEALAGHTITTVASRPYGCTVKYP